MRLSRWTTMWMVCVGLLLLPGAGTAQLRVRARAFAGVNEAGQATTVEAALRMMTEQAAVAFVGTVVKVRRVQGDGFAEVQGVVEVQFAVERAIRGVTAGTTYTIREWGGLWSGTDARYLEGSRLLMLLHAPSASGLSSPVGGADGMIPVRGGAGRVSSDDERTAAGPLMVDLRWVQAKLARPVTWTRTGAAGRNAMARAVTAPAMAAATEGEQEAVAGAQQSVAAAQASVETVVGMMSQWTGGAQ